MKLEQILRAFCLKLTVSDSLLKPLLPGCTFQIHIHTTETSSIEIQKDTEVCTFYVNNCETKCSKYIFVSRNFH